MKHEWKFIAAGLLVLAMAVAVPEAALASDGLLSGTIKSSSGEKMEGVTVSAKAEGQTITTSVFTDGQGNYYFPALPEGKYRVWAQADGYQAGRGEVELTATRRQDFSLSPMKDFARQLTGDQLLAALPEDTPDDRRLKQVFKNNCTGCHQPNYILQNRFDEEGWTAILNLMKGVNVYGIYQGKDRPPQPLIEYHEKELAAYLARMRGPGPSAMKFKLRPRPSGEAARAVITEYDVPMDEQAGAPSNDGSDWSLGTPSSLNGLRGVHDALADFDGNIWFTYSVPSPDRTYGKIDRRTGKVTDFRLPGRNGLAASSHGLTRDQDGILWFNVSGAADAEGAAGGLARLDPATGKAEVFNPPNGMSRTDGTLDVDGKGNVWVTSHDGALRFDPRTHEFKEFKSATFVDSDGVGNTYGLAADREGNGWWAEMSIDIVAHSDVQTGKSLEVKLPPLAEQQELITPQERKLYAIAGSDWNSAMPWAEGPRRLAADKAGDSVWVCDWWGENLAQIDIHTGKATLHPIPAPSSAPYAASVDSSHRVWVNFMNADQVGRFDPKTGQWTRFDLPTLGTESRFVNVLERGNTFDVIVPYWRTSKVARLELRSQSQIQALARKAQLQEQARGQ